MGCYGNDEEGRLSIAWYALENARRKDPVECSLRAIVELLSIYVSCLALVSLSSACVCMHVQLLSWEDSS